MDLLSFLNEGIVLRDAFQGQFIHQIDFVGLFHVFANEIVDSHGKGRWKEHHLTIAGHGVEQIIQQMVEILRKQLIRFIQDDHSASVDLSQILVHQIQQTAGRGNDNVHDLLQTCDIFAQWCSTGGDHHAQLDMFGQLHADRTGLQSQFSCWNQDHGLNGVLRGIDAFEDRNGVGACLASTILRSTQNISAGQGDGNRLFLDGRWFFPTFFVDAWRKSAAQIAREERLLLLPISNSRLRQ